MPDLHSLVDRIHYEGQRDYTKKRGNINYLDGAPLKRPVSMPKSQRLFVAVVLIAAVIIGLVLINNLVISRWQESANIEQSLQENLQRPGSIETIPNMAKLITLDNETIKSDFKKSGFNIYDASGLTGDKEMILYKVPADLSLEEAASMYTKGIGSLNAAQASKLLNGSWYFSADRVNGTSMVVRYADFSTGDTESAVQSAFSKQGFDSSSVTGAGVDESGNTYTEGTLDADGTPCTWRVSALPLDEIYSISGLPEEACYVGVRVTVV